MIAATTLARSPVSYPISLRQLQIGKLSFGGLGSESLSRHFENADARRYLVRDWRPSDGGMLRNLSWGRYPPRQFNEFITIIRLRDGAMFVAPRRWWVCDPRGMPVDNDVWAEAAWTVISLHYAEQRRWFQ